MVHRRTVVAIVALLALIFLVSFHHDSLAASAMEKHSFRVKDECVATHRLGGSVFSVTGDPDEFSTVSPGDSDIRGPLDGWVESESALRYNRVDSAGERGATMFHFLLRSMLLRVVRVY